MKEKRYAFVEVGGKSCFYKTEIQTLDEDIDIYCNSDKCKKSVKDCENCTKGQTIGEMAKTMEERLFKCFANNDKITEHSRREQVNKFKSDLYFLIPP